MDPFQFLGTSMTLLNVSKIFSWTALILSVSACSSGQGNAEQTGAATGEDFSLMLKDTVNTVIIQTYGELHERAKDLEACTKTLNENPTDVQLKACQTAWVKARVPWEQSEGFLFGPVTDQGLDPAMDSWPVDHQQLDALLESNVTLSAENITSNLGGGMKGFHTIEYLLWGREHDRKASDLVDAPRERSYLSALTEALSKDTEQLHESWVGSSKKSGYGERFARAGESDGLYSSALDAVQELIGGMLDICDEVAFGKIAEPYQARDPNLIESQFSYNSILDFADNIRSVQNVYLGSLDATAGKNSLSKIVAKYDEALDRRVKTEIEDAIDAITAIGKDGVTFRDAILDAKYDGRVEKAQANVAQLMDTLNGEVLPLFAR
jgi:uncharacterized iron-regulated protein